MRNLLSYERNIIQELIVARQSNHYENMQFAYILRTHVHYDYLKWTLDDNTAFIETFVKRGTEKEKEEIFYKIVDLIGFFEELEQKGYVMIVPLNSQSNEYPQYHFDRTKFCVDETFGVMRKLPVGKGVLQDKGDTAYQYYGKIVAKIETFIQSIVYPLQPLVDFSSDWKTIEQKRFDKNIRWAKWSVIVASLICVITCIVSLYCANKI